MKWMKKASLAVILLTVISAFAFLSCDDKIVEKPNVITKISLDKSELTLNEGESATLVATLTPASSKESVTWSTNDSKVATVSKSGEVKAVAEGSATITASLKNGSKATCNVTVKKKAEEEKTTITLDKESASLKIGETITLVATLTPEGSKEKVTWSSSKEAVATVSEKGVVTAVTEGEAEITASLANGNTATCTITVTKEEEEVKTTITLDKEKSELKVGETLTLVAALAPEDADDKITWSSSKEAVATVSKTGVVTAVSEGDAVITAALANGNKATCTITVTKVEENPEPTPGTGEKATVKFKQEYYTIKSGETKIFKSEVLLTMGKDPNEDVTLRFSTFEDDIISVTPDGVVKGLKVGEAELLVSLVNNEYASCYITVEGEGGDTNNDEEDNPAPTPPAQKGINITPPNLSMMEGDEFQLTIEYFGGLTPAEVSFKSLNPDVATVTATGKVHAKKAGETKIQVFVNGVPQHHDIYVTVNELVKKGKYSYVILHVKKDIIDDTNTISNPLTGDEKVLRDEFVPNGSSSTNTLYVLVDVTNNETGETFSRRAGKWTTIALPDEDDPSGFTSTGFDGSVMFWSSGKFNLRIKLDEYGIDETIKVIITRQAK